MATAVPPLPPTTQASAVEVKEQHSQAFQTVQSGKSSTALVNYNFKIIDVRARSEYDQAHIEGAISTPLDQLQYATFFPNVKLIVYSPDNNATTAALQILRGKGIGQIQILSDSLDALENNGYKITKQQ